MEFAILTAVEVLKKMVSEGFSEAKYIYVLSNMLCENYNLSKEDSIKAIEKAIALI